MYKQHQGITYTYKNIIKHDRGTIIPKSTTGFKTFSKE